MDLKYLNTFKTIVREGSFSKAAEKLNYTQSTITFQIDQLERDLSAQLFEKVGRNIKNYYARHRKCDGYQKVQQNLNRNTN